MDTFLLRQSQTLIQLYSPYLFLGPTNTLFNKFAKNDTEVLDFTVEATKVVENDTEVIDFTVEAAEIAENDAEVAENNEGNRK